MSQSTRINIAIDGYSGCGKSTLAKDLAKRLNYRHIDSGAMYRAITYYFLKQEVDYNDAPLIRKVSDEIHLRFLSQNSESILLLNDQLIDQEIRTNRVNQHVSQVSAIALVRELVVAQQQEMGLEKGVVMDGRDIGTVVFPDAALKLFIKADIDIRVQRRFLELQQKGIRVLPEQSVLLKEPLVISDQNMLLLKLFQLQAFKINQVISLNHLLPQ